MSAPRLHTLVAELTYSCRLRCAYCSNPVHTAQRAARLETRHWLRVIDEAEQLGALQIHFTGGEPLLFDELPALVERAHERQLYTNLITSGVPLTRERLQQLKCAGLDHVQLSLQAATPESSRKVAGVDAMEQKLHAARWTKELNLALTVNVVLHRQNLAELPLLLELAERLEPYRIELANAQYLGWALVNRDQLLPSAEELELARDIARAARERLRGKTDVLFVLPDYYSNRPRACMQGWAQSYMVITPDGLALPCHAARDLPGLYYEDVRDRPLARIWSESEAFAKFRGNEWQPEPCKSCVEFERDFGGCRCQAFALTGDVAAADPTCGLTQAHHLVRSARASASKPVPGVLVLRQAPRVR